MRNILGKYLQITLNKHLERRGLLLLRGVSKVEEIETMDEL